MVRRVNTGHPGALRGAPQTAAHAYTAEARLGGVPATHGGGVATWPRAQCRATHKKKTEHKKSFGRKKRGNDPENYPEITQKSRAQPFLGNEKILPFDAQTSALLEPRLDPKLF